MALINKILLPAPPISKASNEGIYKKYNVVISHLAVQKHDFCVHWYLKS